jgi:hypothetical protein
MSECSWADVPKILTGRRIVDVVHEGRLDSRDTIRLILDDGDEAVIGIFNGDLDECNGLRIDFKSEKKKTSFESSAIIDTLEFTADQAIIRFRADKDSSFEFVDRCEGAAFFVDLEKVRSLVIGDWVYISGYFTESEFELDSLNRKQIESENTL